MKWIKKGLIFSPNPEIPWMCKYGMMPTPIHLPEQGIIRVYFGTTSADNFGVTTYVDLRDTNPEVIQKIENQQPILELGIPGTFDDCGAVPSSIVKIDDKYFLYYVGFQRCQIVPFMLFPGLALSDDGTKFKRYSQAPIVERDAKHFLSFAAPFVMHDAGVYKMWLWIGKEWLSVNNKHYLGASIGYAESNDAYHWKIISDDCILPVQPTEFSVGRPWVIKSGSIFRMFYSIRFVEKLYRLGYAESTDGVHWTRKDEEIGIDVSSSGWDSEMICYPAVIQVKGHTYLFYNGNNNGATGFGWAELADES